MREAESRARRAIQRLGKWRSVLAGWQLGTRTDTDPECQAVRDHREATLVLRAESVALFGLLVRKGVFTEDEFLEALEASAIAYEEALQERFPGFKATDDGIEMHLPEAAQTMKGWKP